MTLSKSFLSFLCRYDWAVPCTLQIKHITKPRTSSKARRISEANCPPSPEAAPSRPQRLGGKAWETGGELSLDWGPWSPATPSPRTVPADGQALNHSPCARVLPLRPGADRRRLYPGGTRDGSPG